jgi:hypothetical protein
MSQRGPVSASAGSGHEHTGWPDTVRDAGGVFSELEPAMDSRLDWIEHLSQWGHNQALAKGRGVGETAGLLKVSAAKVSEMRGSSRLICIRDPFEPVDLKPGSQGVRVLVPIGKERAGPAR